YDRYADALDYLQQALAANKRAGSRRNEFFVLSEQSYVLTMLARWDEAVATCSEIPDEQVGASADLASVLTGILEIELRRGDLAAAQRLLTRHEEIGRSGDLQSVGSYHAAAAAVRLTEGRPREALAEAEQVISVWETVGLSSQDVKQAYRHGLEAA